MSTSTSARLAVCAGLLLAALRPLSGSAASFEIIANVTPTAYGFGAVGDLVKDAQGRLYGTTLGGGGGSLGYGTVFRLTPPTEQGQLWTFETLHSFDGKNEGSYPFAGVLLGSAGELYGANEMGGPAREGTVYRLDNQPGWPITILHVFGSPGFPHDGSQPLAGLVWGKTGLLYGTTSSGSRINGTVFNISPQGDAVHYQSLHIFSKPSDAASLYTPRLAVANYNTILVLGLTGAPRTVVPSSDFASVMTHPMRKTCRSALRSLTTA